jgi:hypothetical protein
MSSSRSMKGSNEWNDPILFISRCSGLRRARADTLVEDSSESTPRVHNVFSQSPLRALIVTVLARKLTVRHVYVMRPSSSPSSRRTCFGAGMPHAHG